MNPQNAAQDPLPGVDAERLEPPRPEKRRTTRRWDATDTFPYCDDSGAVSNLGPAPIVKEPLR